MHNVVKKTIWYRILSIVWIQIISYIVWGSLETNLIVLLSDIVLTTPFYYLFEKAWNKWIEKDE